MIFSRIKPKIDKTVFVGVSGGVDSSVATKRLIDEGYRVVGAFMKTWYPDWLDCDWKVERRDAMRVCAHLNIPYVEYDLGDEYFNQVGRYLVNEYAAGRTPNPDVMCNKYVKFDAFWQAAQVDGADYIATGHYANKLEIPNPKSQPPNNTDGIDHYISTAVDENKDQTYFLWGINPAVVPNILFPIGNNSKDEIRHEADQVGLITATKPDSQGICFLGQVDLAEFLSHYLDLTPGEVVDVEGQVVGRHDSAYIYTIGQRHGFQLDNQTAVSEPLFVIHKDVINNQLIVGNRSELQHHTAKQIVNLEQTNLFAELVVGQAVLVRFRYRQPLITAHIKSIASDRLAIEFNETQHGIAPGQSLVIYQDSKLLGGGIIT